MKVYYYFNARSAQERASDAERAQAARAKMNADLDSARAMVEARRAETSTEAHSEQSGMRKAADYLKAEVAHAVQGKVELRIFEERAALCRGCEHRVDTIDGMTDEGKLGFCSACGCPGSRRSQLSTKLWMGQVACPRGKFAKADGVGGGLKSAAEAIRGVGSTIRGLINRASRDVDGAGPAGAGS
jgi:hypothetical protein